MTFIDKLTLIINATAEDAVAQLDALLAALHEEEEED